ncbi:MFS transporter [Streptomyces sp. NPDC058335]|uniref:MFS transporter n=1 Tax=Streptomyces sp. NPDC058335 TaxID=3346451 RepID=UPI00364FEFA0
MSRNVSRAPRPPWPAFAVLCSVQLMILLDGSIVNVALRSIQDDLGFSQSGLAWVVNAYTVAFGGLLLLSGRLGDLVGRRTVFLTGLGLFTAASLVCGLAGSRGTLIGARLAQGVGAALASGVVLGMIVGLFREPRDRTRALAVFSFIAAAGSSLGLVAGGLITEAVNWHWVFYVNLPVGVVALALALRWVEADRGAGLRQGADALGALLITGGMMLGIYTVVEGGHLGWAATRIWGGGALSLLLIAAFLLRQLRAATPLVPLKIFRSATVSGANLVQFLLIAGLSGFQFLGALYLQRVLGFGAAGAGLAFLPLDAVMAVCSLGFAGRLQARFGPHRVLAAGLLVTTAGLLLAARFPADGAYLVDVAPVMALLGAGAGLAAPAVIALAMSEAAPYEVGLASGLVGTAAMSGGALGLAALATLATHRTDGLDGRPVAEALAGGYRLAFGVGAAVVAVGAVVAFRMPRTRSAEAVAEVTTPPSQAARDPV